MKIYNKIFMFLLILSSVLYDSCSKEFLNAKPDANLVIPSSLNDMQELLDDYHDINMAPALGEVSSDDYYMSYDSWKSLFYDWERNIYTWQSDIFSGVGNIKDWDILYKEVLYANVVLEGLEKIKKTNSNKETWDNIKGSALFIRAMAFFNVAKEFSPMYDSSSADSQLGIPLRLTSDIIANSKRSSLKDTYERILSDLKEATELLPATVPYNNRNRPSKPAAMALLARIYLSVGAYKSAGEYADSTLQLYSNLLDYNDMDTTSTNPFSIDNEEILYQLDILDSDPTIYISFSQGYSIDSTLYKSYASNDLRRSLYFLPNGKYINFKGGYNNNGFLSNGLTTDELYLIKAECEARMGNINTAIETLNNLLVKRWKVGTFTPFHAATTKEALELILKERRKELVMRGIRWSDLKRLNKLDNNIILTRLLNNQVYTLLPNDKRYVLPIPPDVIELSGMQQNIR